MRRIATTVLWVFLAILLLLTALLTWFSWQASSREQQSRHEAAPQTGQFVQAGDLELFVQEMGPQTGPPVLFIHGTGAWSEMWRGPMTALAAAGYHAFAIDIPPFGFSEKPYEPRYSTEDQARRIVAVARHLGLSDLTLVGHSFGCRATVDAAVHLIDRMRALVLIDAAVGITLDNTPPAPPGMVSRVAAGMLAIPSVRKTLVASTVTNPLLTRRLFQLLIDDPEDATDQLVTMLQRPLVVRDSTVRLSEWLQVFLFGDDAAALSSRPVTYRTFAPPTLLLWGEKDQLTPLSLAHQLEGLLPDPSLVILKGVGHIPQVEDERQFTDALLRFLATTVQVP